MAVGRTLRFAGFEASLWIGLYGAYLALRNLAIGNANEAFANATTVVDVERAVGIFHEVSVQRFLSVDLPFERFFDVYYMLGFGPVVFATLFWLATRHRDDYRQLRNWLLFSIAIASLSYLMLPTAPPRLMHGLGIADTVGLSGGHDSGSFAGIKFNPYAAMPSMHVGWSLLIGLVGFRTARRWSIKALFAVHPLVMALTVTATGNHYFLDSIVGVLVALTAAALLSVPWSRFVSARPGHGLGQPCSSH